MITTKKSGENIQINGTANLIVMFTAHNRVHLRVDTDGNKPKTLSCRRDEVLTIGEQKIIINNFDDKSVRFEVRDLG